MAKNKNQSSSSYRGEDCHDSVNGQDKAGQNKSSNRSTGKSSNKTSDRASNRATDKMSDSYDAK